MRVKGRTVDSRGSARQRGFDKLFNSRDTQLLARRHAPRAGPSRGIQLTAPAFDPYLVWLGIPPDARPPTHYQLIGIHQSQTDPKAISAATERRIREVLTLAADCQAAVANQIENLQRG